MPVDTWVYAAFGVLLGLHLVTLVYAYRARGTLPWQIEGTESATAENDGVDEDVCYCDECGAENEVGYRFCRNCVSELPTASPRPRKPRGREQPY